MSRRITKEEAKYLGHDAWSVEVNGQTVYETNCPASPDRDAAIAQGRRWNGNAWA